MNHSIVPALFLAGTLFFTYLFINGPVVGGGKSVEKPKSDRRGVSYSRLRNLKQQAEVRRDLNKQQAILNRRGRMPTLSPDYSKKKKLHETHLDRDVGPAAYDLDSGSTARALTLDQRMDEFLAKRQHYEDLEQMQKEQYVEAFIEEARQMGFRVKINNAMEITDVEKIGE